ncbi:hypothetical protein V3664_14190 [Streptomyces sp. CS62]
MPVQRLDRSGGQREPGGTDGGEGGPPALRSDERDTCDERGGERHVAARKAHLDEVVVRPHEVRADEESVLQQL